MPQTNQYFFMLLQAHVVSAFEQSLSNMTQRLQQLTATAERKVINYNNFHRYITHPLISFYYSLKVIMLLLDNLNIRIQDLYVNETTNRRT